MNVMFEILGVVHLGGRSSVCTNKCLHLSAPGFEILASLPH